MNRKRTALVFRCCNARDSIRRRCRPSSKNYSIRRVTLRAHQKFCSLTHYRKAVWLMPVTVPIRCARWWCNRQKISIWQKCAHWGCIIPDVISSPVICWMNGRKETFVSNERRNMVVLYRRWKPINTTRRVKRCNRYWRQNLVTHGISIWLLISILGKTKPMRRSIA